MTTRAELLQMTPRQVFDSAIKAGLGRARKMEGLGLKENAVARWYTERPEYDDPHVKELMDKGNEEASKEALEELRRELQGIDTGEGSIQGPLTLIGFSDRGPVIRDIDPNSFNPQDSSQSK